MISRLINIDIHLNPCDSSYWIIESPTVILWFDLQLQNRFLWEIVKLNQNNKLKDTKTVRRAERNSSDPFLKIHLTFLMVSDYFCLSGWFCILIHTKAVTLKRSSIALHSLTVGCLKLRRQNGTTCQQQLILPLSVCTDETNGMQSVD